MRGGRVVLVGVVITSTLASLAIGALWIRSYFASGWIELFERYRIDSDEFLPRTYAFRHSAGRISLGIETISYSFNRGDEPPHPPPASRWDLSANEGLVVDDLYDPSEWGTARWRFAGFGYGEEDYRGNQSGTTVTYVCFAHAFPFAIFTSIAAVGFRQLTRARRRLRQGRCLACGYDTRASSDRCSECGEPISDRTQVP